MIEAFGRQSFAVAFVVLMAVPALPVPTGGVTHVFEAVTMVLALELVVGRRSIWLPARWKRLELGGRSAQRFARLLVRQIRWLERFSRPRLGRVFRHRLSTVIFGVVVFLLALTAFVAPPFSGLDTLPALGVVCLAVGVLLEDLLLAAVGVLIGALGVATVVGIAGLVVRVLEDLPFP